MHKVFYFLILTIITLLGGCDKEPLLEIHVIDVGQGDSILIQTPSSKNILVDGGTSESERIVKSYLKRKNIKSIDYLIATHPDSDHIGGLDNIIYNFDVKSLYMPKQSTDSIAYNDLMQACTTNNIDINYLYKGDSIDIEDSINLLVLNPSYIQDDNNLNSIVFNLTFKDKSFLFTGDAEFSNEIDIVNSFDLDDVDFLKVGHHGSNSSTSEELLTATTPDIAVISCGYKNQYGHPHKSTLNNLSDNSIDTYRTDLCGDLVFYSDGDIIYTKQKYNNVSK